MRYQSKKVRSWSKRGKVGEDYKEEPERKNEEPESVE